MEKKKKSEVTSFDERQTMLAFAMIADIESALTITNVATAEREAIANINTLFDSSKNPVAAEALSGWELVYNPAIYVGESSYAENTTMIFFNRLKQQMVIALAGTNVTSNYDWFTEDLEVRNLVPWSPSLVDKVPQAGAINPEGFISQGTATGIHHTADTSNTTQDMNPLAWLASNLHTSKYPTSTITVTGHSLGGALSPVFALALKDYPSTWNPHRLEITINAYSFAGPTPGDIHFRNYLESNISLNSTINTKDVVPHAWQYDMLGELFSLYNSTVPTATADNDEKIIYWLVKYMMSKSEYALRTGHQYERWTTETKITNSVLSPTGLTLSFEAEVLTGGILDAWKKSSNIPAEKALQDITNNPNSSKNPFLTAFAKYLILLGGQHTGAYEDNIFSNPAFVKELKTIFKAKKLSEVDPAAKIVGNLMIQVAAYKASQEVTATC